MADYGLSEQGLKIMQLQTVKSQLQSELQSAFGQNLNFLPESNFGQIVGIWAEREALLWQVIEAIYNNWSPATAEGIGVDNLLAFNNLRRLKATSSKTDNVPLVDANGITKYGLVLKGVPGTVIPHDSIIQTDLTPTTNFLLDADVTIGAAADAVHSVFFSNAPTTGAFSLKIEGNNTGSIAWNAYANQTRLTFAVAPSSGHFKLTFAAHDTAFINYNATNVDVQNAIRAIVGYETVVVSGSVAAGFVIDWGDITDPVVTITASTLNNAGAIVNSVQSAINAIAGYEDARVTGSFAAGFALTFSGDVGSQPIALTAVNSTTLQNGIVVTNIRITNAVTGTPAQGIGQATADKTGPISAAAGTLTVIGSPVTGWVSVNNELDVLPGTNVETDSEALLRREQTLSALARGPMEAMKDKISKIVGVTDVQTFENFGLAALQKLTFSEVPDAGQFKIVFTQGTTGFITYAATSATVQTAIRAVTGLADATVIGDFANGFLIDFKSAGQHFPQSLAVPSNNSLTKSSNPVTPTMTFDRPGKSFEVVVNGGTDAEIAAAIYESKFAGIQSYGSTTVSTLDENGNVVVIKFSRPVAVPIYVDIVLHTDLTTETTPKFNPGSVQTIQDKIVEIGNEIGIGGLIVGFGSNGLVGAFNDVPGIVSYTLKFGITSSPSTNTNIQLLPNQIPVFESFNVSVSYD